MKIIQINYTLKAFIIAAVLTIAFTAGSSDAHAWATLSDSWVYGLWRGGW